MKNFFGIFFIIASACIGGCTVIKEFPAENSNDNFAEIKASGEYLLSRSLVVAMVKNDAAGFVKLLPQELRKQFTEDAFVKHRNSVVESVGEPVSFTFLTKLDMPVFTPFVWKIRVRRTNKLKKQSFYSEVLFKVITGKTKDGIIITSFQFI